MLRIIVKLNKKRLRPMWGKKRLFSLGRPCYVKPKIMVVHIRAFTCDHLPLYSIFHFKKKEYETSFYRKCRKDVSLKLHTYIRIISLLTHKHFVADISL